jgi:hypothetical protein
MKRRKFIKTAGAAGIGFSILPAFGQDSTTAVSNVGEDLDLYAVLDLLEESENLEEFEKALNSEEKGINNLDLNEDGQVDFIKVEESVEGNTHLIVLQVEVGENDFQDVATIEIDRNSNEDYVLQAIGAEELYGEDYIVEPETEQKSSSTTFVVVHTWPLIRFIFMPGYRPWRSPWRWRARPIWWRPWHPLARATYRNRWARSARRRRYRRGNKRHSVRAQNMYKTQRKTAKRYQKSTKKTTQKKQTQQKQQQQKKQQKKKTTTTKKKKP